MGKYTVHRGKFKCHECGTEVNSLRHYIDEKLLTWMCPDKHLSEVSLDTKRGKGYN